MEKEQDNPIEFPPPIIVKGPDGVDYALRQAYAVISPQEAQNVAKSVMAGIATALAASLGYQLVPISLGTVGETKTD